MTSIQHFASQHLLRVRRAEDREAVIKGRHGQIYFHSDGVFGVLLMPNRPRPRLWPGARRRLEAAGCVVHQDGDREGSVLFDPANAKQCRLVVKVVGAKRKRIPSPAQLESLRKAREVLKSSQNHCAEGALEPQNDLIPAVVAAA
jgi:hypothetical protein